MKKLLPILLLSFCACKKVDFQTCDLSPLYLNSPFPIGVAVDNNLLRANPAYRNIVLEQFNSITPENELKFEFIHPEEGTYYWNDADYLADFAQQNNKRMHGHVLVWHNELPGWIYNYTGDWDTMLRDHITAVVGHYKNYIGAWDVVNEAMNDDGTLRNTIWFDHLGSNYIIKAFNAAHSANPAAKLFYNDYNMELNPVKRDAVIRMCIEMRAEGVQVDGIGMQLHINSSYPSLSDIEAAARKISDAGFLVHFSELDVTMNVNNDKTFFSIKDLQDEASRYYSIFNLYKQLNKDRQYGVTIWGVSDADTWIKRAFNKDDIPLLFDNDYNYKPAYCAVKQSLE